MPVTHIPVSGRQINAADWAEEHVVELTDTEVTDALGYVPASTALFSTLGAGLTPTSPGGTTAYLRADGSWATPAGGGGAVAWGAITGTLSSQADLQAALDAKADDSDLAGYATDGELTAGLATKANTSHTHVPGDILSVPTATVFYRKTGGTGAAETQTLATLKTDLALTGTNSGDQTSIVGITGTVAQFNAALTDGDFATGGGTATGTNTGDQTITLTGNVTGSGTGSFAATIANSAVTLAKMADVATATVFYRKTAGSGAPEVQTLATLKTDLGLTGTNSGDQTTITGNAGTATALQNSRNFSITGGGITAASVGFNGTANVALNASVDAGHITLARMADLAASRFIGRVTASTGVPEAMTGTQATTLLDTFTTSLKGLAPASGGGTANFLRADGAWAVPPGGGGYTPPTGTGFTHITSGSQDAAAKLVDTADINDGQVTLAKMANMATASLIYRKTGGSGAPEVNSLATLKTDLGLTGTNSGDQTSIVGITGTIAEFNTAVTDADLATTAQLAGYLPLSGSGSMTGGITTTAAADWAFSHSRTGQVGFHMYNGGASNGWALYQPAGGTDHNLHFAIEVAGSFSDRLTLTPSGVATFNSHVVVTDEAYGSGWDGSTQVPTKNAVYDKIEAMGSSWTVLKLASDFTAPNSANFANISDGSTTLTFTPPANTDWELEGRILIWTTTVANLPRVGLNCPSGANRGYGAVNLWQAGATASTSVSANGGWNNTSGVTDVQMAAGGVLTASVPYLCEVIASGRSGSTPTAITIQLACETAAANTCLAKRGSFIKYRTL